MVYLGYRARRPLRPRPAPPGRLEIARKVPEGSRQLRGRRAGETWLGGLQLLPQFQARRSDRQKTVLAFGAELVSKATWQDGTTFHSRPARCQAAARSESSWKAVRRDLAAWGCLPTVREGCIYRFGDQVRHDPAVYALCLPKSVLRKIAAAIRRAKPRPLTRPLTGSGTSGTSILTRGTLWKGPPSGRAHPRGRPPPAERLATLGEAAAAMAGLIRQWCGQDITDGWVLHLVRKWLRAGYSAADFREAIAGPPGPGARIHQHELGAMRRPRNVLLWRLSLHQDPLGRPWPPPSHVRVWKRNRNRQADAPLREKTSPDWESSGPVRAWLHAQPWIRDYRIRKGIPMTELPSSFTNPPPVEAAAEPVGASHTVTVTLPRLYNGVDAARPNGPLPPGTEIVLGYIGRQDLAGAPDTPHIWTEQDWNQYLHPESPFYGGPELRCSPIYTHDYAGDPAADAANAIAAFRALGFAEDEERIIWWDSEMLIDGSYTQALDDEVYALGALLGKYGLWRTVNQNPPVRGGSWIAELQPARPRRLTPGEAVGQQWRFGQFWNNDVFSQFVYDRCGRGPRKAS